MRNRSGFTLVELAITLLLATLLLSLAAVPIRRARSTLSVSAAQSDVRATFAAARSAAILNGGARVIVDAPAASIHIESAAGRALGDERRLRDWHGVSLDIGRDIDTIRYDALGIGRLANATIRITRDDALATVTVSAYGRVR